MYPNMVLEENVGSYEHYDAFRPPCLTSVHNGSGANLAANALVQVDLTQTTYGRGNGVKASASSTDPDDRALTLGYTRAAIPDGEFGEVRLFKPGSIFVGVAVEGAVAAGDLLMPSPTTNGRLIVWTIGTSADVPRFVALTGASSNTADVMAL